MESELLARMRLAFAALDSKKAYHLLALDVSERTSIAEVFVLCSVGSQRQAQAVADAVDRGLAAAGALSSPLPRALKSFISTTHPHAARRSH